MTVTVDEFLSAEASGFHGARPAQLSRRLDRLRAIEGMAVIFCTEVTAAQASAFKAAGWDHHRVGESVVHWKTSVFRGRKRWATVLALGRYFTGKGGRKDGVTTASVRLTHISTGRTGMVRGGIHTPASVQAGNHWSTKTPRVQAHKELDTRLGRKTRRIRHRHPVWFQLAGLDLNLDMRRLVWRQYMTDTLGLQCCWNANNLPRHGGTHAGGRVIDAQFADNLELVDAFVAGGDSGFDHFVAAARWRITSPKEHR